MISHETTSDQNCQQAKAVQRYSQWDDRSSSVTSRSELFEVLQNPTAIIGRVLEYGESKKSLQAQPQFRTPVNIQESFFVIRDPTLLRSQ
jgi:hypothetical protein